MLQVYHFSFPYSIMEFALKLKAVVDPKKKFKGCKLNSKHNLFIYTQTILWDTYMLYPNLSAIYVNV